MANIPNDHAVHMPLNPSNISDQEDEGCLAGVSDEISKRFVQCSNSPAGTCVLATSLTCAAVGMGMTTTSLLPKIEASTRISLGVTGMCMQVTSLPIVGTMYGSWCTSSNIYKEANDAMQEFRENRDIVVNGLYGQVNALIENRRYLQDHNVNLTRENERLREQRVIVYQPPANRVEFLEARAEAIRERLERMREPIVQQPVRQAPVNPNPNPNPNADDGYNSGVDE